LISDDSRNNKTKLAALLAIEDDDRFSFASNIEQLGEIANYKHLAAMAKTPYIKILCGDDIIYPRSLEFTLAALESNTHAVLCTSNRDVINADGKVFLKNRGLRSNCRLNYAQVIKKFVRSGTNPFGETSFALFRSSALKSAMDNFETYFGAAADIQLYLSVLKKGDLVHLDACLGAYRVWGGSGTAASNRGHRLEALNLSLWATRLEGSECNIFDRLLTRLMVPAKAYLRLVVHKYLT
jgi:glycosyltransferase involved in cell wall biosynthesis